MRLFIAVSLIAVPCLCAAAPAVAPEDATGLIAAVRSASLQPPYAQQEFDHGVSAWTAGEFLSARNHWVRARSWLTRTLPAETPAREALVKLVALSDRLSQPESAVPPEAAATPAAKRTRRRATRAPAKASTPVDAQTVMGRARAARKAGELEKAAQLMRIASRLPGGEGAAGQAEAIERELAQPAR